MAISSDAFRQLGRAAAGAVAIVSGYDQTDGGILALTVSSFVTLSFEPPLAMFAIQHNADSYKSMVESKAFGVSLLEAGQFSVAQRFAQKGRGKTADFQFDHGVSAKVPLIPGALAQIECHTDQIFTSGDHAIVVGLIEAARTREGKPLLYFARQYGSFTPLADS
jgi:flavin reductase (DIM6/NTAB) family NADH-FMN oxidoreductase RutF